MAGPLSWLEQCPLPLALVDVRGEILYWSTGAERLTGLPWNDVVGRVAALSLVSDARARGRLLGGLKERGFVEGAALSLLGAEGRELAVRLSLGPLSDPEDPEPSAYLAVAFPALAEDAPSRAGSGRGALSDAQPGSAR